LRENFEGDGGKAKKMLEMVKQTDGVREEKDATKHPDSNSGMQPMNVELLEKGNGKKVPVGEKEENKKKVTYKKTYGLEETRVR
jgi:hypothetical protein